ncbi:hypothetical protein HYALB_00001073 [Hymenoscyphus albidus]|uniref:Uncharacterized protein n=1 Tax=Hymenoscyphus albidus TaxID=595503 RepID=A0A9N9M2C1_9HELO|nr:hypothetical protein HYALB_00001073 [Hymenoscyphus albidus]
MQATATGRERAKVLPGAVSSCVGPLRGWAGPTALNTVVLSRSGPGIDTITLINDRSLTGSLDHDWLTHVMDDAGAMEDSTGLLASTAAS